MNGYSVLQNDDKLSVLYVSFHPDEISSNSKVSYTPGCYDNLNPGGKKNNTTFFYEVEGPN